MNSFYKYTAYFCMALTLVIASPKIFADFTVTTHDQVSVTAEGLFVNIDGVSVPVESINIANDGLLVAIPKPQAAICPRCHKDTYTPRRTCSNCGYPVWNKKQA
jgi:hypothetical protein